jgi:hypothetical protein
MFFPTLPRTRALMIPVLCAFVGGSLSAAQDFSSYRGLKFGISTAAAAKEADITPDQVRTVHRQPDVIQEIDWQPRESSANPSGADPVKGAVLSFFNGELFRIVVAYDRYKIEGMTADDMVHAISLTYGAAARPKATVPYHSNYGESTPVVARWESPEYTYDLVRTGDQASFAMILYSKQVEPVAEASIVKALKIEADEAPQREIDRKKKRDDEERLALEKVRSVNTPNFRP